MSQLKTYNPGDTILVFAGIIAQMGAEDGYELTLDGDDWVVTKGLDGSAMRSKTNESIARMTIALLPGSPSNDRFSIERARQLAGGAPAAIQLTNLNSTTLIKSPKSWLVGPPTIGFKKEPDALVWTVEMHDPFIFVGGLVS